MYEPRVHDACGFLMTEHDRLPDAGPNGGYRPSRLVCPDSPEHATYIDPHQDRPTSQLLHDEWDPNE